MKKNVSSATALIVFAREPREGRVKTRLQAGLPSRDVLLLYRAFVRDVADLALEVQCSQQFLFYESDGPVPFLDRLSPDLVRVPQQGRDLGERMRQAFLHVREKGFDRAVIIGTDCLTISPDDLHLAFEKLVTHDLVLGPCPDGGYYLIGCREPEPALFQGIAWGTGSVFRQTVARAGALKKKIYLLQWQEDLDTLDALKRFSRAGGGRSGRFRRSQSMIRRVCPCEEERVMNEGDTVSERPWGNYIKLYQESGVWVKRVQVVPGARLSLQTHAYRTEKWIIVSGRGVAVLDDKEIDLKPGDILDVPLGAVHRIGNTGDSKLIFIEVACGEKLTESDIVRLQDDYQNIR